MRKVVLTLHLIIGSYFLPIGIMFAITGGLYTFGVKGDYVTQTGKILIQEAATPDLNALNAMADKYLADNGLKKPTGEASIKKAGTSWQFEWTGSNNDLVIEPTNNPLELKLSLKQTTKHRYFVQLHKAKGGTPFKVLAGFFAVSLVMLFLSGFFMANQIPKFKKIWLISAALGLITFAVAALVS